LIKTAFVEITDLWLRLGVPHRVYTSLEGHHDGGSIKDRMVLGELLELLNNGNLKPGDNIVEASSGSTALSLAVHCKKIGLGCHLFLPMGADSSLQNKLKDLGATVHLVDPQSAYRIMAEYVATSGYHCFGQLFDKTKRRHYHSLGAELLKSGLPISLVVGAVGTSHSLFGVSEGLMKRHSVYSAEPPPHQKVAGVRNIDIEKYGIEDPFDQMLLSGRLMVSADECFPGKEVETDKGPVLISPSFALVLGAVKKVLLNHSTERQTVFAIGSSNKMK